MHTETIMKDKLIITTVFASILTMSMLFAASPDAQAHEGYRDRDCCRRSNFDWVAPAVIGGLIGYELSQPRTVIVDQPPVVYTQPPAVIIQQPPMGYHWQQLYNPQVGQYQMVLVPNY